MNTPSNEILDERFKTMEKQNTKEHEQIFSLIKEFIDSAEKKYATKAELNEIKDNNNNKTKTKTTWIQTWGALLVAIVSAFSMIIITLK